MEIHPSPTTATNVPPNPYASPSKPNPTTHVMHNPPNEMMQLLKKMDSNLHYNMNQNTNSISQIRSDM